MPASKSDIWSVEWEKNRVSPCAALVFSPLTQIMNKKLCFSECNFFLNQKFTYFQKTGKWEFAYPIIKVYLMQHIKIFNILKEVMR